MGLGAIALGFGCDERERALEDEDDRVIVDDLGGGGEVCELPSGAGGSQSCEDCPTPPPTSNCGAGSGSGSGAGSCAADGAPGGAPNGLTQAPDTQATVANVNNCPGNTTLPANCLPAGGTSQESAEWLWCHRNAGGGFTSWAVCACADVLVPNNVTQDQIDQIESICEMEVGDVGKLLCAARNCDIAVGGEINENQGVCRHHAACLDDVLDQMGIDSSFDDSPNHLWNEAGIDTNGDGDDDGYLVMDSYNGIYIICFE